MKGFAIFVFNPPGVSDPSLAIAACRADAVGVINGELGIDEEELRSASRRLAEYGRAAPFGLAIDELGAERTEALLDLVDAGLGWLFLPVAAIAAGSSEHLERLRQAGVRLVAEVTSGDPASLDYAEDVDGWLVKGHESGGWVGEETSLVLMQQWLRIQSAPVYVRGGVGLHNGASLVVAGAAGAVLDNQLLLMRESPLRDRLGSLLAGMVGTETAQVGDPAQGQYLRLLERPGFTGVRKLREEAHSLDAGALVARLKNQMGWEDRTWHLMPMGQDAALAEPWQRRYGTVGSLLKAFRSEVSEHLNSALEYSILDAGAALARSHGTRFPIIQGPMTRVSDTAQLAEAVASEGGLPMLALALMRGEAVQSLLQDTAQRLKGRPWGVGLLGFAPSDLLKTQVAIAQEFTPSFAIIAGGRPDQALALEQQGVPSYLHVPSPRLLSLFLEQGARRFVFEGRECGGHIGPLASSVLWETMVQALLDEVKDPSLAQEIHVVFAGGIHDHRSAAMVAAVAAPLAARGIRVGMLMGTAYLFTREIVSSGSVVDGFHEQALACTRTVPLETGTGHASRGAATPFAQEFLDVRRRLQSEGRSAEEIRDELENLNLGRLRIASKGLERGGPEGQIQEVPNERQYRDGMYMIGQVATLRDASLSVAELHAEVTTQAEAFLHNTARRYLEDVSRNEEQLQSPADVAIVGLGCLLPKAGDVAEYWDNILDKLDAITEIPSHRWDWRIYFNEDRTAEDKIYSRWGGFLDDLAFDPTRYGMPPRAVKSVDPLQLMTLEVVRRTLEDAGYGDGGLDREHASLILGASGGAGDVGCQYAVRAETPRFQGHLESQVADRLPDWTEDSFAGILLNVAAGRSANRFDFGGANFTVDSACASSLTAVYLGASELVDRRSDFVVAGGVDTVQGPFGYLCFSKTQALSPRGQCSTFDASADGIVISEGIATMAMKRLTDAERDGDRIYAVIKGVGASSDGRARSMTAPHPDGQIRALHRAYRHAGYSPATVGLFEAHGTGTVAGDTAELETATRVLREHGAGPRNSAIGSVKTLIGHTKASAGIAGLIKSTLALHHRVLPPHANVDQLNPRLTDPDSPLYLVRDPQPWVLSDNPRRAGVSAFGFGGTNFHITLEEYTGDFLGGARGAPRQRLPAELLVWRAADRSTLASRVTNVADALARGASPRLRDLAYSLVRELSSEGVTAALVVEPKDDLESRLRAFAGYLADPSAPAPLGAYFNAEPLAAQGKTAVLFAGQGTQYPHMMRELAVQFPEFQECLERADALLAEPLEPSLGKSTRLSRLIYPGGHYTEEQNRTAGEMLRQTDIAQPVIGVVEASLWRLMRRFDLPVHMAGGHSYGEYVALHAAGVFGFDELMRISEARGRFIREASADQDLGSMAAVQGDRSEVEGIAARYPGLTVANHNAPQQTILSGPRQAIDAVVSDLEAAGIQARTLAVGAAFHSPLVAGARDTLAAYLDDIPFAPPTFAVYSNTTAKPHATDAELLRQTLADHLVNPVEMVREVEAMYADGARLFVGLGPKNVPESLVDQILAGRPHRVIRVDDHQGGLKGLLGALGALLSEGVRLDLMPLYEGRDCRALPLDGLEEVTRPVVHPPHVWMLNGSGSYPANEPAPQPLSVDTIEASGGKVNAGEDVAGGQGAVQAAEEPGRQGFVRKPTHQSDGDLTEQSMGNDQSTPPDTGEWSDNGVGAEGYPADSSLGMSERDSALGMFQETMRQFLQTQERVMISYLDGGGRPRDAVRSQRTRLGRPRPGLTGPSARRAEPAKTPTYSSNQHSHAQTSLSSTPETEPSTAPASSDRQTPGSRVEPKPETPPPRPSGRLSADVASSAAGELSEETTEKTDGEALGGLMGREQLTKLLLDLVEERTGYPPEMLDLDQNMEADLGIDSIKRVEVVGALLKALPKELTDRLEDAAGELNAQRTLREIIDWLDARAGSTPGRSTRPFDRTGVEAKEARRAALPRFIVEARPESTVGVLREPLGPGAYLVVGQAGSLADEVSAALGALTSPVFRLNPDDCLDDAALEDKLRDARAVEGGLRGVVHLAGVGTTPMGFDTPLEAWRIRASDPHLSLLRVLQAAPELAEGGRVVAASDLGGLFGRGGRGDAGAGSHAGLRPLGGGVGLLKSVHQEWPGLHCKAIDLDPSHGMGDNAHFIVDELRLAGGRIEVGYPAGQRTIFRTVSAPLEELPNSTHNPLEPGTVILATGGARGITADVLRGFAVPGVHLILVGRTPKPGVEPRDTAEADTLVDLRRVVTARLKRNVETVRPVDVEREMAAVLRDREIRANLRDLETLCTTVDYRVADVRDEAGMASLLSDIYTSYGRIDGVLSAAGVIEDCRLEDKSQDSWDRVFGTKIDSLYLLARYLKPESLNFLVIFTSVAGRYGNSGQVDYAAANEVLNRLAWQLYAQWQHRVQVKAVNWGPWHAPTHGSGMVSAETQRKFESRGVELISLEAGGTFCLTEVRNGPLSQVELVAGEGPWDAHEDAVGAWRKGAEEQPAAYSAIYPLLWGIRGEDAAGGAVRLRRTLDPTVDHFLAEHLLDGVPVMPAAAVLELFAEAAASVWPEWQVCEVRDLTVLRGIRLDQPVAIDIVLRASSHGAADRFDVSAELKSADNQGPTLYRATLGLGSQCPAAELFHRPTSPTGSPVSPHDAYRDWLFHGPGFQLMRQFRGIDAEMAVADVTQAFPNHWLPDVKAEHGWIFDPGMIDTGPQMALIWSRIHRGTSALPNRLGRVARFGNELLGTCRMIFRLAPEMADHQVRADVAYVDQDGMLRLLIEDLECTSSPALVRLGGGWKGAICV